MKIEEEEERRYQRALPKTSFETHLRRTKSSSTGGDQAKNPKLPSDHQRSSPLSYRCKKNDADESVQLRRDGR